MKVIFLDIDGVLLPWNSKKLPPNFPQAHPLECLLPAAPIALVNKLAAAHHAQIVISSTWRMHDKDLCSDRRGDVPNTFDLRKFLKKSGLTARFAQDWHTPLPARLSELVYGRARGFEINDWLENHPEVDAWVALDDDSAGFDVKNIEQHLVRLNPYQCFQQKDYVTADNILKGILI